MPSSFATHTTLQVLPTRIGSEMEDLFGAMITEMISREQHNHDNSSSSSRAGSVQSIDDECEEMEAEEEDSGDTTKGAQGGQLRRVNSAPSVSMARWECIGCSSFILFVRRDSSKCVVSTLLNAWLAACLFFSLYASPSDSPHLHSTQCKCALCSQCSVSSLQPCETN